MGFHGIHYNTAATFKAGKWLSTREFGVVGYFSLCPKHPIYKSTSSVITGVSDESEQSQEFKKQRNQPQIWCLISHSGTEASVNSPQSDLLAPVMQYNNANLGYLTLA